MTDRELLEAAAKAAGLKVWRGIGHQSSMLFREPDKADGDGKITGIQWDAFADDGDALRLAVALRLDICTDDNDPHPTEDRQISHVNVWPFRGAPGASEDRDPDPFAATRRAIVRAAASMLPKDGGGE